MTIRISLNLLYTPHHPCLCKLFLLSHMLFLRATPFTKSLQALFFLSLAGIAHAADDAGAGSQVVKMRGATSLPQINVTKKTHAIDTFLFLGAWELPSKDKWAGSSLAIIDAPAKAITLKEPGALVNNAGPVVFDKNKQSAVLDRLNWDKVRATHYAFKAVSGRRQTAVLEIFADSKVEVYNNGRLASGNECVESFENEGIGYLPVLLEEGENIINIKEISLHGMPRMQITMHLGDTNDFQAAWRRNGGIMLKTITVPRGPRDQPALDWSPLLGRLRVPVEVEDAETGKSVFKKEAMRRGDRLSLPSGDPLPPGIYKAIYGEKAEGMSEYFIVGHPRTLCDSLTAGLSRLSADAQTRLDIEAQFRRADVLLAEKNYDFADRAWQKKVAFTLHSMAVMKRMLEQRMPAIPRNATGMHIRGFVSSTDGSTQFYRIAVPPSRKPSEKLPLLVMVSPPVVYKETPFIEGPTMADHHAAELWAEYGAKYGFAVLWPGYKNAPEGHTYESRLIEEAIQSVEKNYDIDPRRISVFGSCGAGYSAGRLLAEYDKRYAALVYDRAIYDRDLDKSGNIPSLAEWVDAVNPSRHLIKNPNLRIFVLHEGKASEGHGEMALTSRFLADAAKGRRDIPAHLGQLPIGTTRMDIVFRWIAPCVNEHPGNQASGFAARTGYTGPISEIFATPFIIVEGTQGSPQERRHMQAFASHLRESYARYFHGAACVIKKDNQVTLADIDNYSLILVGNPKCNLTWQYLRSKLPLSHSGGQLYYENRPLGECPAYYAMVRHPQKKDGYILLIGAEDMAQLASARRASPFRAWYDCCLLTARTNIIPRLEKPAP